MNVIRPNRARKPRSAQFVIENQWFKAHAEEFADCLRCPNCKGIALLTEREYIIDAWAGRKWSCGNCGTLIDPLGLTKK